MSLPWATCLWREEARTAIAGYLAVCAARDDTLNDTRSCAGASPRYPVCSDANFGYSATRVGT
jgi:hypothetical protein